MINIHAKHERYAAHELHHFLTRVVDEPILLEAAGQAARNVYLVVNPAQSHEVMIEHAQNATTISGQTASSLLHAVYGFLEKLGYVFSVRGPIAPTANAPWPAPFALRQTPVLARRGIRQHINFPMDISCLPLEKALEYVRNLARLKLNFLTFHLYPNQGWLRMDYKGYQVGVDPKTTLYYSEPLEVCRDPVVRAQSANSQRWFIPEFESHYQAPDQHNLLRAWLREVMRCAKTCGMTVAASVEAISPTSDKQLAATGQTPGLELYARVTAELALAALEQYPEIDQIEIISQENEVSWPSPTTLKEALAALKEEFQIADADWPAAPPAAMPGEPEEGTAKICTSVARGLQVIVRAFELVRQDERAERLLGPRTPVYALYETLYQSMPYMAALARRLLPAGANFAILPAYSSRRTARDIAAANVAPELLARTRLYAWCEFDGLMYLLQNECEGVHRCIAQASRDGNARPAQLACNHWRTAENELAINYLAKGAFEGLAPREFYAQFLGALMGEEAAPDLAKALTQLDEATAFAVEHLFNLGFCSLGCWSLKGVMWEAADISRYRAMLGQVADLIVAQASRVTRPEGLERCTLWVNRLGASQIHCDVVLHLRGMRDMIDWSDAAGKLPPDKQAQFCRHAHAARKLAGAYVALCARCLPDRMSEGVLTSYEHVLYGLLDKTLAEFIGSDAPTVQEPTDGPPSPLGGQSPC